MDEGVRAMSMSSVWTFLVSSFRSAIVGVWLAKLSWWSGCGKENMERPIRPRGRSGSIANVDYHDMEYPVFTNGFKLG